MQYPTLYAKENSRHTTDIMRGYNHNLRINDGEFFNMKNLTSDFYPVLAPRPKRGMYATPESPQGMIAKNQLCYVDGTAFVMGSTRIEMGLSVEAHMCPKTMLSMGAFVLIMPDKKWINTLEPDSFGDIEATYTSSAAVTFSLTSITGQAYAEPVISPDEPKDPKNMDYWIDTSDTPHVLKQYSESNGIWTIIATTYVKISTPGIGKQFEQYDGVTISGVESERLQNLNANMVIFGKGDDYIVVSGLLDKVTSQSTPITVSRQMPYMDHVIESGNRIWGCRYGCNPTLRRIKYVLYQLRGQTGRHRKTLPAVRH
jgi:hypothetical protein